MESIYCIGLDVHKKTISYCVKDASGRIHAETIAAAYAARRLCACKPKAYGHWSVIRSWRNG